MPQVFNNTMVAHVWAQGEQAHGRSHNGNFYFDGRILYSYGTHFAVGVRLNGGQAVLNSDSYSVSTSGMQSDARQAVRHMETVSVPKLTDIARALSYIANNGAAKSPDHVAAIIAYIEANAAALSSDVSRYDSDAPSGSDHYTGAWVSTGETYAAALLRFCGIPAARASAAIKRGLASAAKREKAEKVATAKRDKAEAIAVADMSANEFDSYLGRRWHVRELTGTRSNDEYVIGRVAEAAKAVFRMQKTAKAVGLSAKRLESLKVKRAGLLEMTRAFAADSATLMAEVRAQRFAHWQARYDAAKDDAARLEVWRTNGVLSRQYPENSQERGLLELAHSEGVRLDSEDKMRKQAEARAAWLAGEGPRHVRLDGPNGSALVRRSPDGERLETSHGADVPWEHAVKAFRFIRLCVERGEAFHTNGRTVRVGFFKVDRIEANGDMVAGCHRFAWPVMRELAEREGVLALAPSAEAVTESDH